MTAAEPDTVASTGQNRPVDELPLRAQLLAEAIAKRDVIVAALAGVRAEAGDELDRVAGRVWGELIRKLASGQPIRLHRWELPKGHAARRGCRTALLVLTADDRLVVSCEMVAPPTPGANGHSVTQATG